MAEETPKELLERVYALQGPEEAEEVYDGWADRYDTDTLDGMGYVAPTVAVSRLLELTPEPGTVLDAGCGTGLVGAALAERVTVTVDGVDLSQGMLDQAAARGVYRDLGKANLTERLDIVDDAYDAALCVGTLTDGHVGPVAFDELVRVVRPGGLIVATVLSRVWESGGYRAHVDQLVERGLVGLREAVTERSYHTNEDITCRLVVLDVR